MTSEISIFSNFTWTLSILLWKVPSWHSRLASQVLLEHLLWDDGLCRVLWRGGEHGVLRTPRSGWVCSPLICCPQSHRWAPLPVGRVSWPGTGLCGCAWGIVHQVAFRLAAFTSVWTSRANGTHPLPLLSHFPVLNHGSVRKIPGVFLVFC